MSTKGLCLDPVIVEVLWSRLQSVVEEQARALMRTAFSAILTDSGDLAAGLFDARANMIVQATVGTPGHINTMATGLRHFMEKYPITALRPGDVLIGNDAYKIAGHLNDVTVVTPVFRGGRAVGTLANCCHMNDIGGRGLGTEAHDIYEEGLHIPFTKLYDQGRENAELMNIIQHNVRSPEFFFGDLHAMVVANDIGSRRFVEILTEFGLDDIEQLSDEILRRTEEATRAAFHTIPDGVYDNTIMSDGVDEPIELRVAIHVQGDEISVDFTGSSGASRYGINVPLGYTTAYTTYALKCVIAPDIPNNEGAFRPVRVTAAPGSILNAIFPAPVAARSVCGHLAAAVVMGALARALPRNVVAEGAVSLFSLTFRMFDEYDNLMAANFMNAGGMGAREGADGLSATAFPSAIRGTPVEVIEVTSPLFVKMRELRPDSGGAGQWRGGLGQIIQLGTRSRRPWHFPCRWDRVHNAPLGYFGGGPGARTELQVVDGDALHPKKHNVLLPGQEVILRLPGGGGYGDPLRRDENSVLADVRGGYVSLQAAREQYGVVISPELGTIDRAATAVRRGSTRG